MKKSSRTTARRQAWSPARPTPSHFAFPPQPNRTYYLEDVERTSITWVDTIKRVLRM